uniref:Uncharacterized protein n=1 Tax=Magallana gigas TaxID=29159 RepID=K1PY77_MAGGI
MYHNQAIFFDSKDCEYNYRRYPIGESFQDGCKVCMCQGRGKVVCSEEECPYHRSKKFELSINKRWVYRFLLLPYEFYLIQESSNSA